MLKVRFTFACAILTALVSPEGRASSCAGAFFRALTGEAHQSISNSKHETLGSDPQALIESVPNSRVQFQTSFVIEARDQRSGTSSETGKDVFWDKVTQHIQRWLKSRNIRHEDRKAFSQVAQDSVGKPVEFISTDGLIRLVSQMNAEGDLGKKHLSLLFEHPDRFAPTARVWRTNIGLSELGAGTARLSLSVLYFPRPDRYIREEVPPPDFWGAPAIIKEILNDAALSLSSGELPVTTKAVAIEAGSGGLLLDVLDAKGRELPVLVVSERTAEPLARELAGRLANDLQGQAVVMFEATESGSNWTLRAEVQQLNPFAAQLIPFGGAIRIFWPEIRWGARHENRRNPLQEYVPLKQWDPGRIEYLRSYISRGLFLQTQAAGLKGLAVATIWDSHRQNVNRRIRELAGRVEQPKSDDLVGQVKYLNEVVELYEKELQSASALAADLEAHSAEQKKLILQLEDDLSSARSELAKVNQRLESQMATARSTQQNALEMLTTEQIVELVANTFPSQIVFSDEAIRGARKLNFNRKDLLYKGLVGLATDMHKLIFLEKNPNFVEAFKVSRGFEIGAESNATKSQSAIERERTVVVDGTSYTGWLHLKYGVKEPGMLRVYFAFDQKLRRVVVTHIATHMRTAGTLRM